LRFQRWRCDPRLDRRRHAHDPRRIGRTAVLRTHIEVVGEVDRGDTILDAALRIQPDVAIVDIDLPGMDGLAAADLLHVRLPDCRTLVLTGLSQPGNLLRALKAHVRGFLLKDAPVRVPGY
jgi:two-component system response regulator DesR